MGGTPNGWVRLAALAWLVQVVYGAEIKRMDGIHRLPKEPQITPAPELHRRQDSEDPTCAASLNACPASLNGGCCPEGYQCASESCYLTTRSASTCNGRTGWFACAPSVGGGCCPDGYSCERNNNCLPPEGVSYTYGCPTGRYLCPESVGFGCCPSGLGCGLNLCYTTEPSTITQTMTITTTESGDETTYTTTSVTVSTPQAPTFAILDHGEEDQQILKFYPSVVEKIPEGESGDNDNQDGGGGGLTTAQLAGIVAGAVAFLILVAVSAYLVIWFVNKITAEAQSSRKSKSSASKKPPTQQEKLASELGSEVESASVAPLIAASSYSGTSYRDHRAGSDSGTTIISDPSSRGATPSSFGGGYQPVGSASPRQGSFDMAGNLMGYFDHAVGTKAHARTPSASSPRQGSFDMAGNLIGYFDNALGSKGPARTPSVRGRPSTDSQNTQQSPFTIYSQYTQLPQGNSTSDTSNDARNNAGGRYTYSPAISARLQPQVQSPLELHGLPKPLVPELVGSPTTDAFASEAVVSPMSIMSRPSLAHHRRRSDSRGNNGWNGTLAQQLGPVAEETAAAAAAGTANRTGGVDPSKESPIEYAYPSFERK